jgi:MFS family permease
MSTAASSRASGTATGQGHGDRGRLAALVARLKLLRRPSLPGSSLGPLSSRNFRLLLGCDVISALGTGIAVVAIPFAVFAVGGTAADVGYVATSYTLPTVAFLLWGGVVADRLPRQLVMTAANAVQALAQAGSAALVLSGKAQVWELMALAAARGAGLGFYFPAAQGLIPQTVPAHQLSQANAIARTGRNIALIGGSSLGGILVGLAGPGWGLAVDAAGYASAGALRVGMRFPGVPAAPAARMLRQLHDGWREFISRRWLWAIVGQFAWIVAIISAANSVLGPVVARAHLGGARGWGAIVAAQAVGAVAGGIVMIRFRPQRMLLAATLAVPMLAVFLFALALPVGTTVVAAAAFAAGVAVEVFGVNWATTMQQEIPPAMLSRVSAYDALGSFAMAPAGTAVAGPLATVFGTSAVLTVGGVIIVVLTGLVLGVPEVRGLRRQPHVLPEPAQP